MDSESYTRAVKSVSILPQYLTEKFLSLASTLTPLERSTIIDELRGAEKRSVSIIEQGTEKLRGIGRRMRKYMRRQREEGDEQSLPTL